MRRRPILSACILSAVFISLVVASARKPNVERTDRIDVVPGLEPEPTAVPTPVTPKEWTNFSLFLTVHPDGDAQKLADFFVKHPEFSATLIFPAHYFDSPERKQVIKQFSILQSSKQIEIALSLENEPNLPLLGDLRVAGEATAKWGFSFSWPEDVAAQIARGSGKYQKRWTTLPAGFFPPYGDLSEIVVQTLKKFRLNWVLAKSNETWGVRFYGGLALIVPPKPPVVDELKTGAKEWAETTVSWAVQHPFVHVDAAPLEDPKAELWLLDMLRVRLARDASKTMITGQTFSEQLRDEFALSNDIDVFQADFSAWVGTPQQKRAWAALADARKAIDLYQRSGRANLQRLDAAIEEMCNCESGEFLLDLASASNSQSPLSERPAGERNFLATLANIYRLCETPVPPNLSTWFAARTWSKTQPKTSLNDGPFFVEGAQSLTWNDPKSDDNGPGRYTYPAGPYPKGMFDLREFTVSWDESDVTITVGVAETFAGKPTNVVPLVDMYVDVNRLTDAGSTSALRRRGNTLIMREAAWEYAVCLTPSSAFLYQAIPGSNPRLVASKNAVFRGRTFSATFPRRILRGDPKSWRLSIALGGTDNNRRVTDEPVPSTIGVTATEKTFGGAPNGLVAPFMDLLDSSSEDQSGRFDQNGSRGPLTLPYVETQ